MHELESGLEENFGTKIEPRTKVYRGSVYMHDFMDGQAISKLRTGEFDVRRIRIG
jgi:hypothetical protein